jgi:hypothetical protein
MEKIMLNRLKYGMIATALCSSLNIAHAEEFMHGFNFTSVPTYADLTTASCETPQQFVYTLTNSGHKPVSVMAIKIDIEDNQANADISVDQTSATTCMFSDVSPVTLATGESCAVALNIQACSEGSIDAKLTVRGDNVGHVSYPRVAATLINATVSGEM